MRARLQQAPKDLSYLLITGLTGWVALAVWVTGVSTALALALFIVGIPAIVLIAELFRWTAELDRQNARLLLGEPITASYRRAPGEGVWGRMRATLTDPQSLRDTVWLVLQSLIGTTFGIVALTFAISVPWVAAIPIWYRWDGEQTDLGPLGIDSLGPALLAALLAIPLAVVTVLLLRGMAALHLTLARSLLSARPTAAPSAPLVSTPGRRVPAYQAGVAIAIHGSVALGIALLTFVIWAFTGGAFWPIWVWFGLLSSLLAHVGVVRIARAHDRVSRLQAVAEIGVALIGLCVLIWLLTGLGPFWPIWPAIGLGGVLGFVALAVLAPWRGDGQVAEQIETLTRTRRDAVDAQATELRRIERDLHDGAQARLVALSMQLGRAEARLADHPEEAELIRQARGEASAAIAELRDLSRGIAPPVLVDRGLVAAVEALAGRSPMPVEVIADVQGRLPAAVENAAYFVCAEALTNAAKHAAGAEVTIRLERDAASLLVSVHDAGPGGADAGGSGLTGLRQRVAALDGTLHVASASGQGTTISAELPCAS